MIGAVAGDIIGSTYEVSPIKSKKFELFPKGSHFSDDTVLTMAIAKSILNKEPYLDNILDFARRYPNRGYGHGFREWVKSKEHKPYNSWGNGSAMRVSPIGFAFDTKEDVLREAKESATITHNHIEGIKGAQATALAIYLARKTKDKELLREEISKEFNYNLNRSVDEIRKHYKFDVSSQGSVPESIISFLDSTSYEDAIRNAISLGGDADTMATIAGGIAQAYYGMDKEIEQKALEYLPDEFIDIYSRFKELYLKS